MLCVLYAFENAISCLLFANKQFRQNLLLQYRACLWMSTLTGIINDKRLVLCAEYAFCMLHSYIMDNTCTNVRSWIPRERWWGGIYVSMQILMALCEPRQLYYHSQLLISTPYNTVMPVLWLSSHCRLMVISVHLSNLHMPNQAFPVSFSYYCFAAKYENYTGNAWLGIWPIIMQNVGLGFNKVLTMRVYLATVNCWLKSVFSCGVNQHQY